MSCSERLVEVYVQVTTLMHFGVGRFAVQVIWRKWTLHMKGQIATDGQKGALVFSTLTVGVVLVVVIDIVCYAEVPHHA